MKEAVSEKESEKRRWKDCEIIVNYKLLKATKEISFKIALLFLSSKTGCKLDLGPFGVAWINSSFFFVILQRLMLVLLIAFHLFIYPPTIQAD